MFVEQLRQAVMAAPRIELPKVSALLWKAYAAGTITEGQASELSEALEARKVIPAAGKPYDTTRRCQSPGEPLAGNTQRVRIEISFATPLLSGSWDAEPGNARASRTLAAANSLRRSSSRRAGDCSPYRTPPMAHLGLSGLEVVWWLGLHRASFWSVSLHALSARVRPLALRLSYGTSTIQGFVGGARGQREHGFVQHLQADLLRLSLPRRGGRLSGYEVSRSPPPR